MTHPDAVYRMMTHRRDTYDLDADGYVVARSNGPQGWDYRKGWRITGLAKRYHSRASLPIAHCVGAVPGHGIIRDWDHGTNRQWQGHNDRALAVWRIGGAA